MAQSWMPIFGSTEIADGKITLVPVPLPPASATSPLSIPLAVVRSNIEFEQGVVELQVWLPEPDASCQIGLSGGQQIEVYAGLNVMGAPYGVAALKAGKWEPVASAGQGSRLQGNQTYDLKLHVQGSNLDLFVNGVKVVSASHVLARGPLSLLLQSTGRVSVNKVHAQTQQSVCFVVMQFTDEYNSLYNEVIKPTCELFGYSVVRADDFYTSGLIIEDITRSIRESTVVIADVTPNNANVFYEVGFAHGIGKPTILLSDRKRDKLPFDISGFRTLFYDNTIGGKGIVEERLKKHLEAIGA